MNFKILVAAFLLLGPSGAQVPLDTRGERASFGTLPGDNLIDGAMSPMQLVTPSDSDRGCCVLLANPVQCTYANRGYCRKLATDKSVKFEFYEGTQCRNVAQCPVMN